jgi:hypothetical protein
MRLALVAAIALSGCCAPAHRPLERIEVPVSVPCVAEAPGRPALVSDDDLRAMSDYSLVLALFRDRRMRQGYEGELEALLAACRRQ